MKNDRSSVLGSIFKRDDELFCKRKETLLVIKILKIEEYRISS